LQRLVKVEIVVETVRVSIVGFPEWERERRRGVRLVKIESKLVWASRKSRVL
jgi:hypothetical protein